MLGWLSENFGVTVPAAALPCLRPLVAVILSSAARDGAPAGGTLLPRPFDRCHQVHGYR